MCAFPEPAESLQQGSRNTRQRCEQCGRYRAVEAEISAATASIAGVARLFGMQKAAFLLGF
jgi:ribosomal protein S14